MLDESKCFSCEKDFTDAPWSRDDDGFFCKICWDKKYPEGEDYLKIPSFRKKWAGWMVGGEPVIIAPGTYKVSHIDGGAMILTVPSNRVFKAKVKHYHGEMIKIFGKEVLHFGCSFVPDGANEVSELKNISILTHYGDAKKYGILFKKKG